jgi:intracellular sulfur oxidation DsrE/DsrF family protein
MIRILTIFFLLLFLSLTCSAESTLYRPSKVVYDFSNPDPEILGLMLDRANLLQKIYQNDVFDSSIVFVIHEGAVPLFGDAEKKRFPEIMRRARGLALGDIIQFRICKASAAMQGFSEKNLQDFVKMVPMADAELVKLQQDGYAYLR